jgi:excisionase family DNA binding protein
VVRTARDDLLSPQEAGDRLGVSVYTVRRWIQEGRIPAYKPGKEYRIRESDLEEFLRTREVRPKAPAHPLEPSFNDLLAAERRIDFEACAGALDHFSGYWWGAVAQGRALDRQQLAEFAESVRTLALMVCELTRAERGQLGVRGKWTTAERERSALWPSVQRFVAVAQQVPDLAEDREAAASEVAEALQPLAA